METENGLLSSESPRISPEARRLAETFISNLDSNSSNSEPHIKGLANIAQYALDRFFPLESIEIGMDAFAKLTGVKKPPSNI